MEYLILAALWVAWCTLHSGLISPPVVALFQDRLGETFRFYRLAYNILALVTLIPVVLYWHTLKGEAFFRWHGPWRTVQVLLAGTAVVLFAAGARHYDTRQFLGIPRGQANSLCRTLNENCQLDTSGVLGLIRHPWYAGGMLLIWARDLDAAALITNIILTGYFLLGTLLEERKLTAQFGHVYREYQDRVSAFFPVKWLRRRLRP